MQQFGFTNIKSEPKKADTEGYIYIQHDSIYMLPYTKLIYGVRSQDGD